MTGGAHTAAERAALLAADFWTPAESLGSVRSVAAADVPHGYRELLDHRSHMTVAMERRHGASVGVRVLAVRRHGSAGYAREILLVGPTGAIVQYGIVRMDLSAVGAETAAEIVAGTTPLGRILIAAGVLRDVHDVQMVEVVPGPRLAGLFAGGGSGPATRMPTYGRVASITLDHKPAVELLEIAAPLGGE